MIWRYRRDRLPRAAIYPVTAQLLTFVGTYLWHLLSLMASAKSYKVPDRRLLFPSLELFLRTRPASTKCLRQASKRRNVPGVNQYIFPYVVSSRSPNSSHCQFYGVQRKCLMTHLSQAQKIFVLLIWYKTQLSLPLVTFCQSHFFSISRAFGPALNGAKWNGLDAAGKNSIRCLEFFNGLRAPWHTYATSASIQESAFFCDRCVGYPFFPSPVLLELFLIMFCIFWAFSIAIIYSQPVYKLPSLWASLALLCRVWWRHHFR